MYHNIIKLWRPHNFGGRRLKNFGIFSSPPFPILPDTLDIHNINLTNAKEKSEKLLYYHEKIKKICLEGGGEKGQTLHVKKNKKILPRDRISSVFDEGSDTLELCLQTGLGLEYGDIPGGGAVCIIGKIHGQYCLATANDGTLKGGTFFPVTVKKSLRAQEVSSINHLPKIFLVDSGGGFLPMQLFGIMKITFDWELQLTGKSTGVWRRKMERERERARIQELPGEKDVLQGRGFEGAYVPMMCDDAGIVHCIGSIYLGGPPLVKAATGEEISSEDLGGATLHCHISGCTDYFASTEQEGFEMLRDVVATLDISFPTCQTHQQNDPQYDQKALDGILGLDSIDKLKLKGIIARLVDGSRLREFKQGYGQNLITAYTFIDQTCVGVVANCGPLTYEDGLKGAHFVQVCDQRNLPILFLQNSGCCEEYWSFIDHLSPAEGASLLRGRAAMMAAVSCVKVPKVTINIGGCHGDDNFTMCGPSFSPNFIFCWPGTENTLYSPIKYSAPAGQSNVMEEDLEKSEKKKPKKSPSAFDFPTQSSWFLAARTVVDGIITPSETRKILIHCIRIFEQKKRINCKEKNSTLFRF